MTPYRRLHSSAPGEERRRKKPPGSQDTIKQHHLPFFLRLSGISQFLELIVTHSAGYIRSSSGYVVILYYFWMYFGRGCDPWHISSLQVLVVGRKRESKCQIHLGPSVALSCAVRVAPWRPRVSLSGFIAVYDSELQSGPFLIHKFSFIPIPWS